MIHVNRRYIAIGLAALMAILIGGTVLAATQNPSEPSTGPSGSSTQPTGTVISVTGQPAGVGTTQTTDEGLTITLVQIIKQGPRWLFQLQIKNVAQTSATVRGAGNVHQFVVAGNTQAAPPNNIGDAQLGSPSASEIASSYPDLPTTLQSGDSAQGWLAIDTTKLDFTPTQLIYRYGTVSTIGCTGPEDQPTCEPATLYQGLIWDL